jgi:hemerythrin-like domain-containing protein|tara:strand:- start:52 stop:309 length:258 start_codon:yes stop_codon:yes gene_type:complete
MKYDIRLCKLNEKKKIIDFIRKYWKKNHILAKNEKLLRFNHIVDRYTGFMKSLVYNVTIDDLYSSDNLDTFGTGKCSKVEEEKKF